MLNNVKQTKFTNLEVLVRHLSFTHVISPGKRHSPVDHGASEHLGQCSSPQGLGNGPVGESNFTCCALTKMNVPSFQSGTKPCLTTPPCPNQIGDSNLSGDCSNLNDETLDGESPPEHHAGFVGGTSGRWIKNVDGHTQHTPHLKKAPPRRSDQREKKITTQRATDLMAGTPTKSCLQNLAVFNLAAAQQQQNSSRRSVKPHGIQPSMEAWITVDRSGIAAKTT